jgi:hypothetical protein
MIVYYIKLRELKLFFSFLVVPETHKRRHHQPARLRRLKVSNGNQSKEKLLKARGNTDVVKRLRSKFKTSEKRLLKKDEELKHLEEIMSRLFTETQLRILKGDCKEYVH